MFVPGAQKPQSQGGCPAAFRHTVRDVLGAGGTPGGIDAGPGRHHQATERFAGLYEAVVV